MGLSIFKQQGKYGVKNETGEIVIHPRFERIVFAQPWIIAWSAIEYDTKELRYNSNGERYYAAFSAVWGKSQVFYENGSEFHLRSLDLPEDICITSIEQRSANYYYGDNIYKATAIIGGEKKACLFKSDGEIILPFCYDEIFPLGHGYLVACDSKYEYKNQLATGGRFNQIVKRRTSAKYGVLQYSVFDNSSIEPFATI